MLSELKSDNGDDMGFVPYCYANLTHFLDAPPLT